MKTSRIIGSDEYYDQTEIFHFPWGILDTLEKWDYIPCIGSSVIL